MPGGRPGYANAQPLGRDKIANTPLPELTTWANALRLPRGGGGMELIDAYKRIECVMNVFKFNKDMAEFCSRFSPEKQ